MNNDDEIRDFEVGYLGPQLSPEIRQKVEDCKREVKRLREERLREEQMKEVKLTGTKNLRDLMIRGVKNMINKSSAQDKINPTHYSKYKIEPITFLRENNIGYVEGNIIKYVLRYADKNGLEDLLKAKRYLEELINNYPPPGVK